jgi:hypothetical protein
MTRRRTPPGAVELHIDEVVIDGLDLRTRHLGHLEEGLSAALLAELTDRLAAPGRLGARPGLVDEVTLEVEGLRVGDPHAAGHSVGRALADELGPRLTTHGTGAVQP